MNSLIPLYAGLAIGLCFCFLALALVLRSFIPFFRRVTFLKERVSALGFETAANNGARILAAAQAIRAVRINAPVEFPE